MVMDWLIVDAPAPAGWTRHAKWNRPSGIGDVSSSNDRPGSTSWRVMSCVPPAFVVIWPLAPLTNGPSMATDRTSGFQLGQVLTSDQIRHTRSGLALASSVLPCDAIGASSERNSAPVRRRPTPRNERRGSGSTSWRFGSEPTLNEHVVPPAELGHLEPVCAEDRADLPAVPLAVMDGLDQEQADRVLDAWVRARDLRHRAVHLVDSLQHVRPARSLPLRLGAQRRDRRRGRHVPRHPLPARYAAH